MEDLIDAATRAAEQDQEDAEILSSQPHIDRETVWHVRDTFRRLELAGVKCTIDTHKLPDGTNVTMWNLIPRKLMPPTRLMRYCCAELKEGGGKGRWIATGVRWEESQKRKSRGVMEALHMTLVMIWNR